MGNVFQRLTSQRATLVVNQVSNGNKASKSDDNSPADEPPPVAPTFVGGRRKSVFAEAYNPEEDEQGEKTVVHPKSDLQRQSLQEAVKGILLFRSLDAQQLGEVLDAMFERKVVADEYIIKQGDDGDNFYVVDRGVFNIYVKGDKGDTLVGKYDNTGSFGELALMYNMPRAATIQATTDGFLWAMDRQTFRKIVLRSAFQKRKMYETLLQGVPILNTLSSYEHMNLADALVPKSYADGDVIVKQGDPADGMYFIEAGTVIVSVTGTDGSDKIVTTIEKGGYFGELALVTHKPRAATVVADKEVRVAFLDVNAFERLLGPCMEIMKRNIDHYQEQLAKIFGPTSGMS